jgi:hypothetical protein
LEEIRRVGVCGFSHLHVLPVSFTGHALLGKVLLELGLQLHLLPFRIQSQILKVLTH